MKAFPIAVSLEETAAVAAGSTLGLEQQLLAQAGQPGLTVLAVGQTNTGKVQGVSLGDGNVVEVYANGSDYNNGTVLYREFMSLGEPICFTGLSNGAIITSTQGFYGMSENAAGANESPMPLLSYGLSFKSTFLYAFRNSSFGGGKVWVVNGPLENSIKLTDGTGVVQLSQENIGLTPWQFYELDLDGNKEYVLSGTNPMMACIGASMGTPVFQDLRLIMPLTNDGITWPKSGFVSAPYDNTQMKWYQMNAAEGDINLPDGISPGSPVATIGAINNQADYRPTGATRYIAAGLISAFSGADGNGSEATAMPPTTALSQVVAQPFHILDSGDGGRTGIAIASPYAGTAKVYEWDYGVTNTLVLAYTVPLIRDGVTVLSKEDQKHPAAGSVSNDTNFDGVVPLVGNLRPGVIIADVPISVVAQNEGVGLTPTIRSQNGTTTTSIINEQDETLMLGWTPAQLKAEITEGADGILYKRAISAGVETWEVA